MRAQEEILRVGLVQWHTALNDKGYNLAHLEEELQVCKGQADLIVLPELFNSGYSIEAIKQAEPLNLTTQKWMIQMSARLQSVIMGSIILLEDNRLFNACLIVYPNAETLVYKKRHLFSLNWEKELLHTGQENLRFEVNGWKIAPYICYDLRFPEWCRNTEPYYDAAVFCAAWPKVRIAAWQLLLAARAIENQAFVIGVNQLMLNNPEGELPGNSLAYDFTGKTIAELKSEEGISIINLQKLEMDNYRMKLPFLKDQ